MDSINIILLLVWMCFASSDGHPLKTTDPMTSEPPLREVQPSTESNEISTRKPVSKELPINQEIHEQVLAIFGKNSILTESSFVKLLNEVLTAGTNSSEKSPSTPNNSTVNESRFIEILKEILPLDSFLADFPGNSTSISSENEDYEDKADYEDDEVEDVAYPEGLGPRLSATLLKILTF